MPPNRTSSTLTGAPPADLAAATATAGERETIAVRTATSARTGGIRPGPALLKLAVSVGAATALLVILVPRVTGADWASVGTTLARVGPGGLALLGAVWLLGLWVHTPALTAAMPGLTHRRALQLNLTGSFVSNLLPLGGAAGTVANWSMARSWGFSATSFTRWAILTNIADTAVKLVMPALAVTWLALAGVEAGGSVSGAAYLGLGALTVLVVGAWLLGRSDGPARVLGSVGDRLCTRLRRVPAVPWTDRAVTVRRECAQLVRSGWGGLAGGKLGYAALQVLLLWLALRLLGGAVAPAVVLAAYAVERVLSMAVITPSATGIVEAGMAGTLVALHTPGAVAVAGVLLYRAFVVGMEIPVGGLWLAWWAGRRSRLSS